MLSMLGEHNHIQDLIWNFKGRGRDTGCFTTLGHNCRCWFHRSLWWKKFI